MHDPIMHPSPQLNQSSVRSYSSYLWEQEGQNSLIRSYSNGIVHYLSYLIICQGKKYLQINYISFMANQFISIPQYTLLNYYQIKIIQIAFPCTTNINNKDPILKQSLFLNIMSTAAFKILGFMFVAGASGLGYLYYNQMLARNVSLQDIMERNQMSKYLLQLHNQMAYSIDDTMDRFEQGYNQYNINNYRRTLLGQATGKILEVCAGSNRNLKFYKPGSDLTLIDWSPNVVGIGNAKQLPALKYNYIVADVKKMPFPDNTFDTVVDTFGLQYVDNPSQAFEQIRRVCKKGGKILMMNEGLSSIIEFHYWENLKWGQNLVKGGYFSNRNWDKIISQFDFEVEYKQRKKNGNLYIYILRNLKQKQMQKTKQQQ